MNEYVIDNNLDILLPQTREKLDTSGGRTMIGDPQFVSLIKLRTRHAGENSINIRSHLLSFNFDVFILAL